MIFAVNALYNVLLAVGNLLFMILFRDKTLFFSFVVLETVKLYAGVRLYWSLNKYLKNFPQEGGIIAQWCRRHCMTNDVIHQKMFSLKYTLYIVDVINSFVVFQVL